MKTKLIGFGILLALAVICWAAPGIVIYWYSQAPHAASVNDNDIMLIERPVPHTNMWLSMSQVKAYVASAIPTNFFAPTITSFVNNRNNVEIGSTVNSTLLTWTLGGSPPTVQSINQGVGGVPVGTLSKTDNNAYTVSRTYTLTVNNTSGSATANTSVSFLSKRYWGPSALASLTDPQIIALNGELNSGFAGFNHTIVCAAQYIYFAFPTSFGVPNVNVNGLLNTAWTITSGPFVNASGATVNYYVYRSNFVLTGTYIVQLVP